MNSVQAPSIITVNVDDRSCARSVLRSKSAPVRDFAATDIESVISKLRETLASVEYGTGLAAIQIGIPYRIAIVNLTRTRAGERIFINPVLRSVSGRLVARQEGCLSLPNYKGPVVRRNKIRIAYANASGACSEYNCAGYEAAVIQHEMDHMDGILYWDRMPGTSQLSKVEV